MWKLDIFFSNNVSACLMLFVWALIDISHIEVDGAWSSLICAIVRLPRKKFCKY